MKTGVVQMLTRRDPKAHVFRASIWLVLLVITCSSLSATIWAPLSGNIVLQAIASGVYSKRATVKLWLPPLKRGRLYSLHSELLRLPEEEGHGETDYVEWALSDENGRVVRGGHFRYHESVFGDLFTAATENFILFRPSTTQRYTLLLSTPSRGSLPDVAVNVHSDPIRGKLMLAIAASALALLVAATVPLMRLAPHPAKKRRRSEEPDDHGESAPRAAES